MKTHRRTSSANTRRPFQLTGAAWVFVAYTVALWLFITYLLLFLRAPMEETPVALAGGEEIRRSAGEEELLGHMVAPPGWRPAEAESRTVVVGDVHGCARELRELLEKVEFRRGVDTLVLVGDLVGKGPLSKEVVAIALEHQALCVRGNHDEVLVRYYDAMLAPGAPMTKPKKVKPEYRDIAESLTQAEWEYLLSWPYYRTVEVQGRAASSAVEVPRELLVVHAGIAPGVAMPEQSAETMTTIRNVVNGKPSDGQDVGVPWLSTLEDLGAGRALVFGHDAVRGLQVKERTARDGLALAGLGLDTGACYGGLLSALVLPDMRIAQVQAHEVYEQPKLPLK